MVVVAMLCVACGRDGNDSANRAVSNPEAGGGDAAVTDSVQGLVAELDQLLDDPDGLFITPRESHLARELVDRQFQTGRVRTLAALLSSPGTWRDKRWFTDVAEGFLERVCMSPALLDDEAVLRGVTKVTRQPIRVVRRAALRQAGVVLAAKDPETARAILLKEYGLMDVATTGEGEPTIAPTLAKLLGKPVPAELTSLAAARALLAESGIDMAGVNDAHVLDAATAYNRLLYSYANLEQFEELEAHTNPAKAAHTMMRQYQWKVEAPTPTFSEPPEWVD